MKLTRLVSALLVCVACERSAPPAKESTASSTTPVATQQVNVAPADATMYEYQIVAPDSAEGSWYLNNGDLPGSPEFFVASHVRHPSGLMVIWFDTAVRATEENGMRRVHVDSVVVQGMQHLEYLARICSDTTGLTVGRVVGLTQEADTTAHPRLAWRFNVQNFRIEPFPTDSVRCMVNEPVDEVD